LAGTKESDMMEKWYNLDREKKSDQNGTLSRTRKLQEWTMLISLSKDK
jgi:hypothetical protein